METKQHPNNKSRGTVAGLAGLALLATAAAIGLAACGGSGSPQVVSLGRTTANDTGTTSTSRGGSTTTAPAKGGNPTELVDEWATCMRHHGDPNQADPTIDSHGVINIFMSHVSQKVSSQVKGGIGAQTGRCSQYLSAAQGLLRAANPVAPPPTRAELLRYVGCMRANGVPNYPDPTGDKANFNGTGIDLNSPTFLRADTVCSKRIHAPAWWINGWGPPGDVSVRSIVGNGPPGSPPPGFGG